MPEVTHTPVLPDEPAAIVGSQFTFEQICAFGLAMGWGDRPLSFVVKNWMDSRPAFAIEDNIGLPRCPSAGPLEGPVGIPTHSWN